MLPCSEASTELLKAVAETGNLDKIEWSDLQLTIKDRLKSVLDYYLEKNKDGREEEFQETYNEKFNFEASRDEILYLINSFNDAPFTIQRICELLYSPFTHYDRLGTFLRGLEKNLRVTSFNSNWPNERQTSGNSNSSEIMKNDSNNCEVNDPSNMQTTEEATSQLTINPQPSTLPLSTTEAPATETTSLEATSSEEPLSPGHEKLQQKQGHDSHPKEQIAEKQIDEKLSPVPDEKCDTSSPMREELTETTSDQPQIEKDENEQNKDRITV